MDDEPVDGARRRGATIVDQVLDDVGARSASLGL